MTRFRWSALAVSTAALATAIWFGASSLAATHTANTPADRNYHGPPQAPAVSVVHGTNYRGPARTPVRQQTGRDRNAPASIQQQWGAG
jgi:hypothetical protein